MKKSLILFFTLLFMNLGSAEGNISKINGLDIWWNSFGNPEDPAVLMIMGLNSNSKVWSEKFIQELVSNDLHVIIFDNRDIGKSAWVTEEPGLISFIKILPNFLKEYFVQFIFGFIFNEKGQFNMENPAPAEYNLSDMANDGVLLLENMGIDEAHIIGASMGGMIAQVMALEHSERVKSLTLFFTTPGFDTPGLSGPNDRFKQAMKESFILNGYQVSNSGHIFFPSFGKIYVLNKTVEQVRGELYNKIVDENILINPNIDVKHINAHFTILGEVNKPGKYDYIENNLNIFEAIGMANGLTITGERNNLRIIRGTSESKNEIINIDLTSSSLFDNPKKLQIVSGDIIIINPNNTRIKNAGIIGNSGTLISLLSFILSSIIVINSN